MVFDWTPIELFRTIQHTKELLNSCWNKSGPPRTQEDEANVWKMIQ